LSYGSRNYIIDIVLVVRERVVLDKDLRHLMRRRKHWVHQEKVEQSQITKSGFDPTQIHNTNNLIAVDKATHAKISGYYSSKQAFTGGKTVRDWLAGQSFEAQFEFGIDVLKKFGVIN
jgi:hypothetical protein